MTETTTKTETRMGLVTCGKDFNTLHIGTVVEEIRNADKPWKSTSTVSAVANCAGNRHVSNKYRYDLTAATCPRCRAAYLGDKPAVSPAPAAVTKIEVSCGEIQAGDYLTLEYGNGTQTAYVSETTPGRLMVYRLIGYRNQWTGPRPLSRTDARIMARTAAPEGSAPPAVGFISAR